jgi:tetratricopeptide (TPR) repeat protein
MSDQPVVDTNSMMRRRNLRVTEQLLGELEAKRYDSALTKRILAAPTAFPHLLRACFLAQDRKFASARADVEQALEYARGNPVVELVAAMILYSTRDYQRAIEQFESAAKLSRNAAHRARQQIVSCAGNLGWEHDVRRALEAAIADEPDDPSWHAQAVRFFVRGRHWQPALDHALEVLELAPESAGVWMEAAGLHARLDQREQALAALRRALELMPEDQQLAYHLEAARVAIDAGDFELARENLERARELDPEDPLREVALAELHGWAGDYEAAAAASEAALALDGECGPALRMRGALECLAGDHQRAIATLERAIELDASDYQAHVWLSEAYLRTKRYDEAHAQLHHGTMNAGGFLFVAWLLRFLIVAYESEQNPATLPAQRTEEFAAALRELCPELADECLRTRDFQATVAAVEAAITALRGNRSVHATHVVDGGLQRLHARTGCRHECRWALQLLRVATGEECLERFADIIERYPGSSLPHCHRGELKLWLGDYEGGEADLRRAIAIVKGTRWAWIGLSTLGLLRGDYRFTLDINAEGIRVMNDTEGPAVYVYRGEAKRELGRLDEAIAELEAALKWHPARASATINLALAYQAAGRSEEFEALWLRLRDEQAPGLLSDAAHELGLTIFFDQDGDEQPSVADEVAVLEHALEMMGGNRSSGLISYHTRAGQLRFVQHWPHHGHGPHDRDHEHLEQAKRMLLKALARYNGPRPVR